MRSYDPKRIEKKWQKKWADERLYATREEKDRPKSYVLDMFPYPSGEGLHVGHLKGYIATDIYTRFRRMNGDNVLHPMGWDAFGLPAENFAIKNKVHPRIAVEKNIARFKEQLEKIGFSYDWDREINTTDPAYYTWTQWMFLQMFNDGLVYRSNEPINWCPSCKTGLANEDLEDGKCERCGSVVEQKPMEQWVIKIREYADPLLEDLVELQWPEAVKESQRNWIGRSEGAEIAFAIKNSESSIKVFTTRPDTLFGATYIVLAPEHPLVEKFKTHSANFKEIEEYSAVMKKKTDIERTAIHKEKTGVELKGIAAINPANGEEIPVWIADYVLPQHGTGAIMAVPAHDERDFAFAKKYGLAIRVVVEGGNGARAYTEDGIMKDSAAFSGMQNTEVRRAMAEKYGVLSVEYKLRDWVFSRQRYWGEPIPLVFCGECKTQAEHSKSKGEQLNPGWVALPEEQLPLELPDVEHYEPSGTGESPLANITEWVNTACPRCGGAARRETHTMPQWAGSCWYYLRYIDPKNNAAFADKKKENYWMPVDMYVGGVEHATRHLIYARFWHKFLYDKGLVSTKEPFLRLKNQGLIAGEDGRKMSKRWGNVINPDDIVESVGADALRLYEMFMGPFEDGIPWNMNGVVGSLRFLEKVWRMQEKISKDGVLEDDDDAERALHETIKKVGDDITAFKFNTAVAQMMIFANILDKKNRVMHHHYKEFLKILAPFVPHTAEELWEYIGESGSVHATAWSDFSKEKLKRKNSTLAVQIDGRVRAEIVVASEENEESVKVKALALESVQKYIGEKQIIKIIVVKQRLISIATGENRKKT